MNELKEIFENYGMGLLTQNECQGQAIDTMIRSVDKVAIVAAFEKLDFDTFQKVMEQITK